MEKLDQDIARINDELVKLRRDLHCYPELGFQERDTAAKVAAYMEKLGFEVQTGVGGSAGVIGLLRGAGPGRTFGLRACLDALAAREQSGVPFASKTPGVMHACGHDGNMTITLGAAKILAQHKDRLKGNVKFIFQSSEEDTGGAAVMIAAGALKNPDVDCIVTPHNWTGIKAGVIAPRPGPCMASSDLFQIEVIGKAGHGAWPQSAVDPIVMAAEVITALQKVVSREIDPMKPAAITIGKIYGGTAVNIIPEKITLDGTARTFDPGVRKFIEKRVKEIATGVTKAARGGCKLTYNRVMPPLINDAKLTARAAEVLRKAFGGNVRPDAFEPTMGCEEFSLFQEKIPGLFLYLGNDAPGDDFTLHAPNYKFNDEIIPVGVKALCEIVFDYLK